VATSFHSALFLENVLTPNAAPQYRFLPVSSPFPKASGTEQMLSDTGMKGEKVQFPSTAALSVYLGHDGLMDFTIESRFQGERKSQRETIVLACASKLFFANGLKSTGGSHFCGQPDRWYQSRTR